ncbi:MAG: exonuclease SbcCD subunit D [Sphingobacteriia bacterium]|nr:exonuclease SbcCD subunit D [Sphingobacteriia bacterium]NCC39822.1 exonuclease SbcCD subunit D [Gammaproteobacteria bacterium]
MRLLHTSDWHLGQTFHDFDRTHEHQSFLDGLLDILEGEQVDALLIAGDVFDNPNPSAAAQRQLYRFLGAAKRRLPRLDILIIAGNHDSPGRLEAPEPLLGPFDVRVVGSVERDHRGDIDLERLIVPLRNRDGEIAAWCLAIPYLRPGDVPRVERGGDPYLDGIALLYRQALELALRRREPGQAIIALGHCHMSGAQTSEDSERRILIGGVESLAVEIFDPAISYVALGHLHRAQRVGGQERVRYSGSPLPMSFTEIQYPHQVLRVDLAGQTLGEVTPMILRRPVELLRIPKEPAPLDEVLDLLDELDRPEAPRELQPYLQARVRLDVPEPGLRARIESALEGKSVRLAKIETTYGGPTHEDASPEPVSLDDLARLQPDEIFTELFRRRYGAEPSTELLLAFRELLLTDEEGPAS